MAWTYDLGTQIGSPKFCDAVLQGYLEVAMKANNYPTIDSIEYAYAHTKKTSPLQSFLVNIYVEIGGYRWIDMDKERFEVEFPTELASALDRKLRSRGIELDGSPHEGKEEGRPSDVYLKRKEALYKKLDACRVRATTRAEWFKLILGKDMPEDLKNAMRLIYGESVLGL